MNIRVDFDTIFDFYCGLILNIFRNKHELGKDDELIVLNKLEKEIVSKLPFPIGETKDISIFIDDNDIFYIKKYLIGQLEIQKNIRNSKLIGGVAEREIKVLEHIYNSINSRVEDN